MFGVKRKLKNYQQRATMSRTSRKALWSKLSTEFDQTYPATKKTSLAFRYAAVGLTAIVLLFGTGTGVYAYESPTVTEGHPLHFFKQGIEQVQGTLKFSPEARSEYHAKMMDRRLREAEHFVGDKEMLQASVEKAAAELGFTLEELQEEMFDPDMREQMIEKLSEQNVRFQSLLWHQAENPSTENVQFPEELSQELEQVRTQMRKGSFSEH